MNDQVIEQLNSLSGSLSIESIKDRLKEMIAIPSENPMAGEPRPGHREKEIGEYYLEQMSQLGMAVSSRDAAPGRPNVFGTRQGVGERPSLMLCGHLDTVPAEGYEQAHWAREAASSGWRSMITSGSTAMRWCGIRSPSWSIHQAVT